MSEHTSVGKELAKEGGRLISHVLALALGVILMIAGTAMGVSLVLLPIVLAILLFTSHHLLRRRGLENQ